MWWASPARWRRELRSPEFRQIEIVDGDRDWQKSEGNYFPPLTTLMSPTPVRGSTGFDRRLAIPAKLRHNKSLS
jgi:hypothetical protein